MCARFVVAMNRLGMNASEVAKALGYANATTISKVQRGETFLDVERLFLLAQIEAKDGQRIDLNWLICGKITAVADEERTRIQRHTTEKT
jgi:transcriptional regulator with XRE-family HTH domain